jgi:phage tail P2-like protein
VLELKDVNLLDLQTSYMKQDITTQALCAALTPQFQQLADEVKACLIYSRVDQLDNAALDELAWSLHIDWYDSSVPLETKRRLVKDAIKIHRCRGTPYAVEQLIEAYFGDGYIQEWFEYGGAPYMFKVITTNSSVTGDLAAQFTKVLDSVKNIRSHLEEIIISLTGEMETYFAGVMHTGDYLTLEQVV